MPDRAWMINASCRGHDDPDLWFPTSTGTGNAVEALAVCAACPVRVECANYARCLKIPYGVWGGSVRREKAISVNAYLRLGHGTEAGYKRHRRAGEQPCRSCTEANSQASRRRAAR